MSKEGYAPYNFIPFSDRVENVPKPYSSREDIADKLCEKKTDRISGYIEFDIKLETPLYIAGLKDENNDEIPFKDGNGNIIIPGSTIRGLIKSHVEMLSFSYPQIEDRKFMYRKFADASKKIRKDYESRLKGDNGSKDPVGVKCGIIYKNDDGDFFIQPLENFAGLDKNFISVHEADLRGPDLLKDSQYMYNSKIDKFTLTQDEKTQINSKKKELNKDKKKLEKEIDKIIKNALKEYNRKIGEKKNKKYKPFRTNENKQITLNGVKYSGIILNSKYIGGKTHHYLVSCIEKDTPITVEKKDVLNYMHDYEVNCIQNKDLITNKEFYALPEKPGKNNGKIFFYKMKDDGNELLGFGPTQYFRIFYDHSVADGIPYSNEVIGLDYAQALFGFIGKKNNENISMKSKLSFQNVRATNAVPEKDLIKEKVNLLSPKGTAFQLYLDQTGKDIENLNTYNDDNFQLRGYKLYLKRKKPAESHNVSGKEKEGNNTNGNNNQKIESSCVFLPPDKTKFQRVNIYYENLRPDELGLLLLAIKYDATKNESHMIGHAKPYGYGKVTFENISLYKYNSEKRYLDANWNGSGEDASEQIELYKNIYKEKISALLNVEKNEYENLETIKAYKEYISCDEMDKCLEGQGHVYMDMKKDKDKKHATYGDRNILPNWDELMKKYRNH